VRLPDPGLVGRDGVVVMSLDQAPNTPALNISSITRAIRWRKRPRFQLQPEERLDCCVGGLVVRSPVDVVHLPVQRREALECCATVLSLEVEHRGLKFKREGAMELVVPMCSANQRNEKKLTPPDGLLSRVTFTPGGASQ
jgi:hypothetical protein